jgi:hypothetical protein
MCYVPVGLKERDRRVKVGLDPDQRCPDQPAGRKKNNDFFGRVFEVASSGRVDGQDLANPIQSGAPRCFSKNFSGRKHFGGFLTSDLLLK